MLHIDKPKPPFTCWFNHQQERVAFYGHPVVHSLTYSTSPLLNFTSSCSYYCFSSQQHCQIIPTFSYLLFFLFRDVHYHYHNGAYVTSRSYITHSIRNWKAKMSRSAVLWDLAIYISSHLSVLCYISSHREIPILQCVGIQQENELLLQPYTLLFTLVFLTCWSLDILQWENASLD